MPADSTQGTIPRFDRPFWNPPSLPPPRMGLKAKLVLGSLFLVSVILIGYVVMLGVQDVIVRNQWLDRMERLAVESRLDWERQRALLQMERMEYLDLLRRQWVDERQI